MKMCITSSRRIDLLRISVASFLKNCKDLDLIDGYYIFDDRSNIDELKLFKREFPQFRIFSCNNGQAFSLQKIWQLTKDDDWYFHSEDDWEFIAPGHYIRDSLKIANLDYKIKNVTLRDWNGVYILDNGIGYYIHTYKLLTRKDVPNELLWEFCLQTDNQWYGLSFNPGIISPKVINSLGGVSSVAYKRPELRGWDKELAIKYLDAGYKRANLTKEYIKHIGGGRRSLYKGN